MKFLSKLRIETLASDRVRVIEQWNDSAQHVAPFNRFYYIFKGSAEVRINGKPLLLREGYAYILPAGSLLRLQAPKKAFEQLYIHFNASLSGNGDFFSFFDCPLELSGKNISKSLPEAWWKNFKSGARTDVLDDLNREAILRLLINPFIAEGIKKSPERQSAMERFEKIITYIDANCHKQIKIAELAAMVFLQPTYFSNLFAKHFGVPPRRYIALVRINKAQHLLEHTKMSVKSIADEVGYEDELYFSRVFKQLVDISPTAYRRQRQTNPY